MAKLYIAEYAGVVKGNDTDLQIFNEPPLREQTVAVTASSLPSLPFLQATQFVEISTDTTCSIAFAVGTSPGNLPAPVATVSNKRLAANERHISNVYQGAQANNGNGFPVAAVAVISNT